MTYDIEQVELKPQLTLAKVTVLSDEVVIFKGEQEICLPTGSGVNQYIEDIYLVDIRRQPNSIINGLILPIDKAI